MNERKERKERKKKNEGCSWTMVMKGYYFV